MLILACVRKERDTYTENVNSIGTTLFASMILPTDRFAFQIIHITLPYKWYILIHV
jgi:hypothetical protein